MAVSPIVVSLHRRNISDTLLILLLVLAADAAVRAAESGHLRSLVWAGVLVGLSFQAKMLQAWLVLPALFGIYLVAAPIASFLRRVGHVALATLAVVVVSLSYMSAVSLVPRSAAGLYVDGSCNDSLFTQVFSYNGFSRLGGAFGSTAGCNRPSAYLVTAARYSIRHGFGTFGIDVSWDRLLHGPLGHDDAWLLLPALVAVVWLLVLQRRRPCTILPRAAVILVVRLARADLRLLQWDRIPELLLHRPRSSPRWRRSAAWVPWAGVAPAPATGRGAAGWPR